MDNLQNQDKPNEDEHVWTLPPYRLAFDRKWAPRRPGRVTIGSTSEFKVNAVKRALKLLGLADVPVESVECTTEVNEQPVGYVEMKKGALARARAASATGASIALGIESGLVVTQSQKQPRNDLRSMLQRGANGEPELVTDWCDTAVVMALTTSPSPVVESSSLPPNSFMARSILVQFPTAAVEQARRLGFDKHTVGSVLMHAGAVQNANDPHSSITNGLLSREDTLVAPILEVLCAALSDPSYFRGASESESESEDEDEEKEDNERESGAAAGSIASVSVADDLV